MFLKIIRSPKVLSKELARHRRQGKTLGFIPTMGALHEGHLSLIRACRRETDIAVVSIFVNPTQFGPKEDFRCYPRPVTQDAHLLRREKVDYLFHPTVQTMYPKGFSARVSVGERAGVSSLTQNLCGKSRPGHFRGVATVVAKLFHIVSPDTAYFGAKDYQQAMVIRRMILDLDFPIQLRLLPTVREKDGLAMSSRNVHLSPDERKRAHVISETLFGVRDELKTGRKDLKRLRRQAIERLKKKTDRLDYFEIVDPDFLFPLTQIQKKMVAAAACFLGKTRLIDNVIIRL